MPSRAGSAPRRSPGEIREAIERFLSQSRQPALLEPGDEPFQLGADNFRLEFDGGRPLLQAWDEKRNLVRTITGIIDEQPGKLQLSIERFGKRTGSIELFDRDAPVNHNAGRRGTRLGFREQFRRFLSRRFPGWKIVELTTEADLEHSLSPAYPRAFLSNGSAGFAAIGAPREGDVDSVLAFGLIWLDYLRSRRNAPVHGLALFLPSGRHQTTCLRIPWLDPRAGKFPVHVYSEQGFEEPLDTRDSGNLETHLDTCFRVEEAEVPQSLSTLPCVERIVRNDGALSFRIRGLEFARLDDRELRFGIDRKRPVRNGDLTAARQLAMAVAAMRTPDAADRGNPLYARNPELWLESQVRAGLGRIDPTLFSDPVYGQVPAFAGGDRGVIDLLAVERGGRLAVVELKASEDLQLPLQALDYWMRVKWHLDRDEFAGRGYFPGIPLSGDTPRILLVAPALDFHPTTETILRYFSPGIAVERIGVGAQWRSELTIMFRMEGAGRPF